MPTNRTIPRSEWQAFFDTMSKALRGSRAEVEVASLELGDQIAAEWLPIFGITYDTKDDLLDVAFEGTSHLIHHPQQVLVLESDTGIESVAVLDDSNTRQIVKLKRPLLLEPASPA